MATVGEAQRGSGDINAILAGKERGEKRRGQIRVEESNVDRGVQAVCGEQRDENEMISFGGEALRDVK